MSSKNELIEEAEADLKEFIAGIDHTGVEVMNGFTPDCHGLVRNTHEYEAQKMAISGVLNGCKMAIQLSTSK